MARVLIVDDQENQRRILSEILIAEKNHTVAQASNVDDALVMLQENQPEVVLTDLKMPGKSGLSLLEELSSLPAAPEVIVITAFSSVETAVKATRLGAYDYIAKPVKPEKLLFLIEKAAEKYRLRQESRFLKQELASEISSNIIAESLVMRNVLEQVEQVARTDSTVLITGETGTGKECVARLIHVRSRRNAKPLRSINCAAFSESLLDSELFGYEKGSFTGANSRKEGIIESVSGGTLFLDEIGDMSPNTQAKVLRVIQEKRIRRVGGNEDVAVDIRIITASNKDLKEAIRQGKFREDLFYRINVIPITIPPLRERKKDIPVLINHFFSKMGRKKELDREAMSVLLDYDWPGNVRELEALVERIAVFHKSGNVSVDDLPTDLSNRKPSESRSPWVLPEKGIIFEDLEKQLIAKALEKTNGNMMNAAKLLGMSYRAFRYRAIAFGLRTD
jgi:two-component system response regulator PilR (NtrC family)